VRLTAIAAAKARLQKRQRDAERGRSAAGDACKPKDKEGKPYKRNVGVPAANAQGILKRAS
jgi:hypothetical protein